MAKSESRKAAMAAYRERKPRVGIYALHCPATGQRWVGRSTDLDAIRNRILFALTHRGDPHRDLQQAWDSHGPDGLAFEDVEILDEELTEGLTGLWLKSRLAHWVEALGAKRI